MSSLTLGITILIISAAYFFVANRASSSQRAAGTKFHSLPHYYGWYAALLAALPALAILLILTIGDDIVFRSMALDYILLK